MAKIDNQTINPAANLIKTIQKRDIIIETASPINIIHHVSE